MNTDTADESSKKQALAEGEEQKHETGASGGLLEQDKVGVKRLVEALQCNLWSNM